MCLELRDYDPEGDSERDLRIGTAVSSLDSVLNFLYNFLDMVIISTYVKFSNRLMSDEVQNVARKFSIDQQYHDVLDENRETVQRYKAQRRHEEYRKLADEQLKQILATMMALKTQREGASGLVSDEFLITGQRPISYYDGNETTHNANYRANSNQTGNETLITEVKDKDLTMSLENSQVRF